MENKIIPCDEVNEQIDDGDIEVCGTCSALFMKEDAIKYGDMYFCKEDNLECFAEYLEIDNEALKVISENYKKEG